MMATVTPLSPATATPRSTSIGAADLDDEKDAQRRHLAALLVDTATGDRAAFREVYALSSRFIFGVILAVMGSRELAEEVAQDVYLTIWQRASGFDTAKGNPMTWMAAIARNRAIDRLRSERARGFVTFTADVPDFADDIDVFQTTADAMTVRRVLGDLKPDYRKALILTYFKGYTHTELAAVLDVPVGTAKSWVRRGLEAMKETLQ